MNNGLLHRIVAIQLMALLSGCTSIPSAKDEASALGRHVREVLCSAVSVKAIEYRSFSLRKNTNSQVLTEKHLTASDVQRLADCFTDAYELLMFHCISEPHHTIQCTMKDGSITPIRICFLCARIDFGDPNDLGMAGEWDANLRRVLPEMGIPVREREFYKSEP